MKTITNEKMICMIEDYEKKAQKEFKNIEKIAFFNQKKVLDAFKKNKISAAHFNPSTGYGYDDIGRESLAKVFSDIFKTEASIVSPLIANGTHAISLVLFGLLRPNDILFSITGKPYDTLDDVINGVGNGSLSDYNIKFKQSELLANGELDYETIENIIKNNKIKIVFIQRSKGYAWRNAMSVEKIGEVIKFVKNIDKDIIVVVDNCYGEFVQMQEPTEVGADVVVGSLIKNIGGGVAPTGGYISGKKEYIEQISYRLTAPSLGSEVGSYINGYLSFFQGVFLAPSIVKNALKGSVLFGYVFYDLGYETMPTIGEMPYDIIKSIKFKKAEEMIAFCDLIQKISPIDSYVTPLPWDMPGYNHKVIMAAGTFIQGASLELSADGTVCEPYIVYLQGGLTYEHCKLVAMEILKYFHENKIN